MLAAYEPGSRPSPDPESAGALVLDFQVSRIVRNICALFKPPRLWHFFIAVQTKTGIKCLKWQ